MGYRIICARELFEVGWKDGDELRKEVRQKAIEAAQAST